MCEGTTLEQVMTLTSTPPGNRLLTGHELTEPESCYPLELMFCKACHHVQLGHVVDPRILYQKDYLYVTGTSSVFGDHLRTYAADIVARFGLRSGALVADIGSNDGTCLRFFQRHGLKVIGVDPATEIAKVATASGIETIGAFFSQAVAADLRNRYGPAALITSHNACAHIDHLDDVMRGVADWLCDDGVFVLEVGYFLDVFSNLFFDTIYHEHLDYHTVAPFSQLFARTGLELLAVQRINPQGGSIRVIAQKAGGPHVADGSAKELVALETMCGLDQADTLTAFGDRIAKLGERLRALLGSLKSKGMTICAYGAPTKAVTLLSHFGIGADSIDFVVEDNPLKHGRYLPLSHIPVVATDELYRRRPDYALILAWNFAASIMRTHQRYADLGGRFIVPMPEPRVV